ncbi:MAG: DEAD/DEAH box helicase [Nitrospinaceae bacterium]|nr:DEAD/DEAH box helicase [Nitrospinaceae bacterium]NIR55438.1 DEAD/DEAH box helicase [Nitrospinaceae bacterium]NIS85878.1 DEAD/DEAH box helicase [Nitrospinaceae bacterium]NIT82722.1 DEAD/DEAH box helicase [Nitrospinaceae bacterium]NIU44931.1 DEAD/DEAH box helicase [Nitrospinaceae bacterium]
MAEQFDLFAENPPEPAPEPAKKEEKSGPRIQYFDLETQKSADDVGGWGNIHKMGLAVGVVWDSVDQDYSTYLEADALKLVDKLKTADLVIGFNVIGFDYTVLQPYANEKHIDLQEIPTFDMLTDVHRKLNHRLSLNNLAECTLGAQKTADGLESLKWWKEYLAGDAAKLDQIIEYCKMDVQITRDLFLFGKDNGYVEYTSRSKNGKLRLNVDWNPERFLKPSA